MKYIKDYKLFESKNIGIVYHFTDIFSLNDITEYYSTYKPILKFSHDDFYNDNSYYISTTRKFNFKWGAIRFTLDGGKISNKYKIKPVSYFSKNKNDVNVNPEQFEERIINDRQDDFDLLKYLIRVDICTNSKCDYYSDSEDSIDNHMEEVNTAYNYFNELKIPCYIVDEFEIVKNK